MFENIVKELRERNKTISTMESCTGGAIVNEITNVEGASEVLKFSAVTYSNEYKIKMGVSEDLIKEYSVYSEEVAKEMSKVISEFTESDYGIGVTGRMNRVDKNNLGGNSSIIYVSLYDRKNNKYLVNEVDAVHSRRIDNKTLVVKVIGYMLKSII